MASPEIEVNPDVLRWARSTSGYSLEEAAKQAELRQEDVVRWESTTTKIHFSDLEKLAKAYRRPTTALLLDKPPVEQAMPPYFRKKSGKAEMNPEVRFAIRKARYLQGVATDLEGNGNGSSIVKTATLEDSPEKIARRERERLGMSIDAQSGCDDARAALKAFRDAIEKQNVFVFQIKMPKEAALGFSLPDKATPVIALNKRDASIERKIFTLFHEYAHVLLGKSSICADVGEGAIDDITEVWCNRFAGEFLLSAEKLKAESIFHGKLDYAAIGAIANKYRVSKHMVFVRMKVNGLVPSASLANLEEMFGKWKEPEKKAKKADGQKKSGGGPPQAKTCVSEKGKKFVSMVIENERKGKITTADALGYLSIKLNNLDKVGTEIGR